MEGAGVNTKEATLKVFVSDKLDAGGLRTLEKSKKIRVDNRPGLKGEELKEAVRDADAVIIRSETKLTKEIINAAKHLRVIGRAGVGVDNIDVGAATKRGIIVMNTPAGNTISTAELTMAMILALARKIPQAYRSLKGGEWNRAAFKGSEVYRKVLGVIGFGRIGNEVAHRANAFGMRVMVHDPFIAPQTIRQANVTFHSLKELLAEIDFMTVHTPLTPDTKGLIGKREFALMKKGVRIVNCARGGIIDEKALHEALESGKVAGAALDVFEKEPVPKDHPLVAHPEVIAVPHLGAATVEAQENVSLEVAEQVVDALLGKEIRNSVNIPSLDAESARVLRPWAVLAEKLGLLETQLFEGDVQRVEIRYSGEVTGYKVSSLTAAFLKGLLAPVCGDTVNFINAGALAVERGMVVNEVTTTATEDFANAIQAQVVTSAGTHLIMGTLFANQEPRIVRIDGFYIDAVPRGTVLAVTNSDIPGFVGEIGGLLGKAGINIAEMTLGRQREGTTAFSMINVDSEVPEHVLDNIRKLEKVKSVKVVRF